MSESRVGSCPSRSSTAFTGRRDRAEGRIQCSLSAIFGSANLAAYSASKNAIKGLTEALAIELKKHDVRVADVLPGIVDTAMLPPETRALLPPEGVWRLVQPREVAETVWAAYGGDRIHWYVPTELKDLHVMAVSEPEQTRDYFIALGRD